LRRVGESQLVLLQVLFDFLLINWENWKKTIRL
jgi:hypothetical protein